MNDPNDANDPLLISLCEDEQLVDDLHNWEYYTENFDTYQERELTPMDESEGESQVESQGESQGESHGSSTQASSHVDSSHARTLRNSYQVCGNITYDERDPVVSSRPVLVPHAGQANAAQPQVQQNLGAFEPQCRAGIHEAFPESKQDTSVPWYDEPIDVADPDDTSMLHSNFFHPDAQLHPHHSNHLNPTNDAEHMFTLYRDSLPYVPVATGAALYSQSTSVVHELSSVTRQPASPLSLLRQQPARLKPLSAYNYFFRNERNNILAHMMQPGDPLPDTVSDFSSQKMEQLLHEHWYVNPITVPYPSHQPTKPFLVPTCLTELGMLILPRVGGPTQKYTERFHSKSMF
jgi:hypothetical protein